MEESAGQAEFEGLLGGVRVLEIGDELGEYCGRLLAGLGADVVRVEPPGGEVTRDYGPFYQDEPHRERSLHFWHFNLGKRSVVVDLDDLAGRAQFLSLVAAADVVLDSRPPGYLASREVGYEVLRDVNGRLIYARISPFGDSGPWSSFIGSDLVHLALGGVMMNCGYDPEPNGFYETPPVAPQMWQSYAITGEMAAMSIAAALCYRLGSGHGQSLTTSVHQSVSQNTETDIPDWLYLRQEHRRLTCRHSTTTARAPSIAMTKDGRYVLPYRTYVKSQVDDWDSSVALLKSFACESGLDGPQYDTEYRATSAARAELAAAIDRMVAGLLYERDLWKRAQELGLPWAPIRRPDENAVDEHWVKRGTFVDVYHPEIGESFRYIGSKWITEGAGWPTSPRPPLTGEHTEQVIRQWSQSPTKHKTAPAEPRPGPVPCLSPHGKPFALADVRVVDLGWMVASAGAGRFLTAMGAQVIRVEHASHPDRARFTPMGLCPVGGRAERAAATEPLPTPPVPNDPNRSGAFMEINSGKLGLSLNTKTPRGREILEDLIRDADVLIEGYSPGTMERMGLGYERLKQINPKLVYVQQTGMGEVGTYGPIRTYGPSAAAFSGMSDMSGLPEPYPPAGIGYSYLDWVGAYSLATAAIAALYRQKVTGRGCHIDASQVATGIYLTGVATLDSSVNGRRWSRYGNRSPYKRAAPHGVYRTAGHDRWIAIAAFSEEHWVSAARVLEHEEWVRDPRFDLLEHRIGHQDEMDGLIGAATETWDGFGLMQALQEAGVPAGVCQLAEDKCEHDPQLAHLGWWVELEQAEIGRWPVREHPTHFEETPTYAGGRWDRSGPNYGQDNVYILGQVLDLSAEEIAELEQTNVL